MDRTRLSAMKAFFFCSTAIARRAGLAGQRRRLRSTAKNVAFSP
jgi:hypothetical protein